MFAVLFFLNKTCNKDIFRITEDYLIYKRSDNNFIPPFRISKINVNSFDSLTKISREDLKKRIDTENIFYMKNLKKGSISNKDTIFFTRKMDSLVWCKIDDSKKIIYYYLNFEKNSWYLFTFWGDEKDYYIYFDSNKKIIGTFIDSYQNW